MVPEPIREFWMSLLLALVVLLFVSLFGEVAVAVFMMGFMLFLFVVIVQALLSS